MILQKKQKKTKKTVKAHGYKFYYRILVILCSYTLSLHTFNCQSDKENYIFTYVPFSSVDNQKFFQMDNSKYLQ